MRPRGAQTDGRNIAAVYTAIAARRQSGGRVGESRYLSQLAEASPMAGEWAGAGAALQEGFAFVEQFGERFLLAESHRLDGQVALKRPEPDRARA